MLRNRRSAFAPGVGLSLGLGALATFLGYVLLILAGPNQHLYPEGAFSAGVGFFLGVAGALVLVVSSLPREPEVLPTPT